MNDYEEMLNFHIDKNLVYDALVRSTDDYLYVGDLKKNIYLITDNAIRDFELPGRIIENLLPIWGSLIHEDDQTMYFGALEQLMAGETDEHNIEYRVRNRKGEWVWLHCRGVLRRNEEGVPILFAGIITELQNKGKIDYITGLFTRAECKKRLDYLFEKGGTAVSGGLILLGLDDFTKINTLNNHTFGDSVLRSFAQNVQLLLPINSRMYHFEGDEFAVLVTDCDQEAIDRIYSRIYTYVNRHHIVDGTRYFCTASAGVALLFKDADNSLDLIKYASYGMEYSKNNGKNQCTYFSRDLLHSRVQTLRLLNLLQDSAMNQCRGFYLVYQPQVEADTLAVAGAEALVRFGNEADGIYSPAEFIPILESSGLIVPVGKWIFEEAVKTCKEWMECYPDFVMSINFSYLQLLDSEFNSFVKYILEKYNMEPSHIVVELTESCIVLDMERLKTEFSFLRGLGIDIAMDDFGTGYSSLGLLTQSPADIIKIDRIFTDHIDQNDFNRKFINMVVHLCHSINLHVCIEGVERLEELQAMQQMGADMIQGDLISKPLKKDAFMEKYLINRLEEL